ncbi:MAG: endoribonuclease YicC domain-containing protein, partial [bacterium]
SEFYRLLNQQDPVGKSLNFLLQEMVREVTTVNSKAYSVEITRSGIEIKKILEELREQIQNIE